MADTRRRRVFDDNPAVRVADVNALTIDEDLEESPKRPRAVNGERPSLSKLEELSLAVSCRPFWRAVEYVEQVVSHHPVVGRPRQHTIADAILFWFAAAITGGLRRADDELGDPVSWRRLAGVVAQQGRTNPAHQLSPTPITRFQYSRFFRRFLGKTDVDTLRSISRDHGVDTALAIGAFATSKGSRSRPDSSRCIAGDGTVLNTMFNPRKQRVDRATGEITYSRHDPDGRHIHQHKTKSHSGNDDKECVFCSENRDSERYRKSPDGLLSYESVFALVRIPHRRGRVILDVCLRQDGESDASAFTNMVLNLKHEYPELARGLQAAVYDMALHGEDSDRLQDAGVLVIVKVPLDPGRKIKARVMEKHSFKLVDGTVTTARIHVVDGTPCLKVYDGDAEEWYLKLCRFNTQINHQEAHEVIYTQWRVPDHPLADNMGNASVRIRHNSSESERQNGKRRAVYLRAIPESDPYFDRLFGGREDTESNNSQFKASLRNGRARSVGKILNELNQIAYQMTENNKAMYAHYKRTGDADTFSKRYSYKPPSRARPLLKAA